MSELDIQLAAAEAGLARIDDEAGEPDGPTEVLEVLEDADGGWHVEDENGPVDVDDDEDGHVSVLHDDLLDTLNEAFNARDLEGLLEVLADDVELPGLAGDRLELPERLEDLWERRPTCLLTRAVNGTEGISVLWEIGDEGRWWPLATLHVDDVVDGRAGVLEFSDDVSLLDELDPEVPDDDLDEGSRWEEWDEGAID
ncbi:MAG: hypothetical protein R3249_02135 [Nitriliruptorales bacterium]|nr:hypothetical protein [Nitriliruptorales bacterium]